MADQNNFSALRQALEAHFNQGASGPSARQRPRPLSGFDLTPPPRPPVPPKPSADPPLLRPPRAESQPNAGAPIRRGQRRGPLSPSFGGTAPLPTAAGASTERTDEDIKSMSWYHGNITKEDGIEILKNPIFPQGSFLVRDSSSEGNYVIMQKTDTEDPPDIINIRIASSASSRGRRSYSRENNRVFSTMAELIDYYSANLSQQGEYCILTTPVGRVDPMSRQMEVTHLSSSSSDSSLHDIDDVDTEDDVPTVTEITLTALCDLVTSHPSILSFKTNDVMKIEERSDGEWSYAKNITTGHEGYILAGDESLFVERPV